MTHDASSLRRVQFDADLERVIGSSIATLWPSHHHAAMGGPNDPWSADHIAGQRLAVLTRTAAHDRSVPRGGGGAITTWSSAANAVDRSWSRPSSRTIEPTHARRAAASDQRQATIASTAGASSPAPGSARCRTQSPSVPGIASSARCQPRSHLAAKISGESPRRLTRSSSAAVPPAGRLRSTPPEAQRGSLDRDEAGHVEKTPLVELSVIRIALIATRAHGGGPIVPPELGDSIKPGHGQVQDRRAWGGTVLHIPSKVVSTRRTNGAWTSRQCVRNSSCVKPARRASSENEVTTSAPATARP